MAELVAEATRVLAAAGVPSPRVDAELLAAYVLGVPRARLVLVTGWDDAAEDRYRRLVAARARRVPVQHLTGSAGFGHLELAVGPGVFVPRPETELLADWASRLVSGLPGAPAVVDLGSGSGALALEIAHRCPAARVTAVERSEAASTWLRRNAAARAAAGDRPVVVVVADVTDPAALGDLAGRVDVVVCNPPYVPEGTPVPAEVAGHDPPEAVFAGPDGLAVIRPVVACAAALLRPGGWFGMEHDDTHGEVVPELLRGRFTAVTDHRDLAGRPRYVTGRRAAAP